METRSFSSFMLSTLDTSRWSLHRMTFLIAGIFVLGSVLLGMFFDIRAFYFTGFVGCMQIFYALTGYCPMAMMLKRCGFRE